MRFLGNLEMRILEYVEGNKGVEKSIVEIKNHVGNSSYISVHHAVKRLERDGLLIFKRKGKFAMISQNEAVVI